MDGVTMDEATVQDAALHVALAQLHTLSGNVSRKAAREATVALSELLHLYEELAAKPMVPTDAEATLTERVTQQNLGAALENSPEDPAAGSEDRPAPAEADVVAKSTSAEEAAAAEKAAEKNRKKRAAHHFFNFPII